MEDDIQYFYCEIPGVSGTAGVLNISLKKETISNAPK